MSSRPWGYRRGPLTLERWKVDSTTSDIKAGDFLVAATAGYVKQAAAGNTPLGVAWQEVDSPSADGDSTILVNTDPDAVYEYPPDAGTVTQGLVGTTMDIGGAQSIDIDASADDIITVMDVDIERNTLFVKLTPTFAGVV